MIPYFSFNQIQIGPIILQVWGLMASLGFLAVLYLSLKEAKRGNIEGDRIWDILILTIVGMITGSKLLYVFFHSGESNSASALFSFSGFSSLGGIILASAAVILYAKFKKINIWKLADVLTPGLIAGIIVIRLGCFLVYDHLGKITNLPWAREYLDQTVRHPIALYYLASAIAIFSIICYLKKRSLKEGTLFLVFALAYSFSAFIIDFFRCNDLDLCDKRVWELLTYSQLILSAAIPVLAYLLRKRIQS